MKKSKLDPHREFIVQKLIAPTSIAQLRRDLASIGCSVSRSHLTDWIEESGIKYTKRKAGRPKKAKRQIFQLLSQGESGCVRDPLFEISFQGGLPAAMSIATRKSYLTSNDLPSASKRPSEWPDLERYIDLTDVELMILAYFRSDLVQPPVTDKNQIHVWFASLYQLAEKLRAEIEAAWKGCQS